MRFRLTYQGTLFSESNKVSALNARATHKHDIRKALHPQLRRLWEISPGLYFRKPKQATGVTFGSLREENTIDSLAPRFQINDYRFVPLVHDKIEALCSVDVLFLRSSPPGRVFVGGDIDNRLKTLFDGLTMPIDAQQLGDHQSRDQDEDPFFVLLQNDALITRASVETDTLLQPISGIPEENAARVILTITTSVARIRSDNIAYA